MPIEYLFVKKIRYRVEQKQGWRNIYFTILPMFASEFGAVRPMA